MNTEVLTRKSQFVRPPRGDSPRGSSRPLWWVLAVALTLRLLVAFVVFPIIQPRTGLAHGSDGYEHVAATLAAGGGYRFAPDLGPTMYLVPAYPLFLAGLFLLTSHHLVAAQLAQCVLDTLSCYLVYRLGERSLGRRVGLTGAAFYAIYPGAMIGCSRFLTEPLFVFLSLSFVLLFARYLDTGRRGALTFAGVTLAAAVLCKSVAGALPVFLLVCGLFLPAWRLCRARVLGGLVICALIAALGVAPWVYRNYLVTGRYVYPSTLGGAALYTASVYVNHPEGSIVESVDKAAAEIRQIATDHGIRLDPRDKYPRWFYDPKDEVVLDDITKRIGKERIFADRVAFARHVVGNCWRFWLGAPTAVSMAFSAAINVPLMILAAVGLVVSSWWRRADLTLWVAVGVYLFLSHVAVLAVVRYALTVMPLVCLLAGAGGLYLWDSFISRNRQGRTT